MRNVWICLPLWCCGVATRLYLKANELKSAKQSTKSVLLSVMTTGEGQSVLRDVPIRGGHHAGYRGSASIADVTF